MRYTMGSRHFFRGLSGFVPHDHDYIEILDTNEFSKKRVIRGKGMDLIQLKRKPKEEIITDALAEKLPMCVGKFLIPGFCKEIGFGIEDLPRMKPLIDKLDEKHLYEKIIFESYLINGDFVLTEEQRLKAYESYRQSRK